MEAGTGPHDDLQARETIWSHYCLKLKFPFVFQTHTLTHTQREKRESICRRRIPLKI